MSGARWYEQLERLDQINRGSTSAYRHSGFTGREIMLTRHGHHIAAVDFSDLTGVTVVILDDGSTDSIYIRRDQLPQCRPS